MTECRHFDVFDDGTVCCCKGCRCVDITPGMCERCIDGEEAQDGRK